MNLQDAVAKYLQVVQEFGQTMRLADFGLPAPELTAMVAAWDEDYHLHKHFELIPSSWMNADDPSFTINGIAYTAILFRESIREVLE